VYRDPHLGVILREAEPTNSQTQEDGVMHTWVRSRWQVSCRDTLRRQCRNSSRVLFVVVKRMIPSILSANPKYGNNTWQYYNGWNPIWQVIGSKKPLCHEGKKAYHIVALGPKRKKGMRECEWFLPWWCEWGAVTLPPPRIHLESHIPQMSPGQWGAIIEEAVKYTGGTRSCAPKHKNKMGEVAEFQVRVEWGL
jgi:hypothetical protein